MVAECMRARTSKLPWSPLFAQRLIYYGVITSVNFNLIHSFHTCPASEFSEFPADIRSYRAKVRKGTSVSTLVFQVANELLKKGNIFSLYLAAEADCTLSRPKMVLSKTPTRPSSIVAANSVIRKYMELELKAALAAHHFFQGVPLNVSLGSPTSPDKSLAEPRHFEHLRGFISAFKRFLDEKHENKARKTRLRFWNDSAEGLPIRSSHLLCHAVVPSTSPAERETCFTCGSKPRVANATECLLCGESFCSPICSTLFHSLLVIPEALQAVEQIIRDVASANKRALSGLPATHTASSSSSSSSPRDEVETTSMATPKLDLSRVEPDEINPKKQKTIE
jgi:hypothetical protein